MWVGEVGRLRAALPLQRRRHLQFSRRGLELQPLYCAQGQSQQSRTGRNMEGTSAEK